MGALYHLLEAEQRVQVTRECLRVLKSSGIFVVSYLNRHASILHNCGEKLANIDDLLKYSQTGIKNTFYRSTPKEKNQLMIDLGVEKLYNVGTDGSSYIIASKIDEADDKTSQKWLEYHYATCEDESILGLSLHGLYIGRKREIS